MRDIKTFLTETVWEVANWSYLFGIKNYERIFLTP